MNNKEIRALLKETNIYMWMLADKLLCHENTLYKIFRYELTAEQKQKILIAIEQIQSERKEQCI